MNVQNHVNPDFKATYGKQLIFHTGLDGSGLAGWGLGGGNLKRVVEAHGASMRSGKGFV